MELPDLDPIIHPRTRRRIMAVMDRNRTASFVWVRGELGLTDGNLGSHVLRRVSAKYVESGRILTRDGFQVWLRITPSGNAAFAKYLSGLMEYLRWDSL